MFEAHAPILALKLLTISQGEGELHRCDLHCITEASWIKVVAALR